MDPLSKAVKTRDDFLETKVGSALGAVGSIIASPFYFAAKIIEACAYATSVAFETFFKMTGYTSAWENGPQQFFNKTSEILSDASGFFESATLFGPKKILSFFKKQSSDLDPVIPQIEELEKVTNQASSMTSGKQNIGPGIKPTYYQQFISMFRNQDNSNQI